MAKLIRLKPFDAKKGHVIRRYTAFTTTFEEHKGWYRVSDHVASYLATVHQVPNDEDSPLAFDVCSQGEAERIDAAERKKAEERARAAEPNVATARDVTAIGGDLTTADLRDPGRRSRTTAAAGRRP
jgi:hypothetical protein